MEIAKRHVMEQAARSWTTVPTSGAVYPVNFSDVQSETNSRLRLLKQDPLRSWYPASTTDKVDLVLYCLDSDCNYAQSSPGPRNWLPLVIAGSVLTGLVLQPMAWNNDQLRSWQGNSEHNIERLPLPGLQQQSNSIPVARHVEELETRLHLTRSQLAQAIGVERATLYQWFRGVQPRAKTGERLEQLRQFSEEWTRAGLGSARAAWYLRVPESEHTLGALLTQDPLDIVQLGKYIQHAKQTPQSMEIVEPKSVRGFAAEDKVEERRRRSEFFPPTFRHSD